MVLECALCMLPEKEKLLSEDPYAGYCPSGAHLLLLHSSFPSTCHDTPVMRLDKRM
jgi:hypothetical protein